MLEIKPEPYCDAVHILAALRKSLQPISVIETHLFAYLACILGLWRGRALSDWGYSFAVTSEGFPYSADFEQARVVLEPRGLAIVDEQGRLLPVNHALSKEIEELFSSERWMERRQLIEASVSCALAFPVGSIRYAIGQSPGMKSAILLHQRSALFSESDIRNIYQEYEVIQKALDGGPDDMLSPAVIWLSARLLSVGAEPVVA